MFPIAISTICLFDAVDPFAVWFVVVPTADKFNVLAIVGEMHESVAPVSKMAFAWQLLPVSGSYTKHGEQSRFVSRLKLSVITKDTEMNIP